MNENFLQVQVGKLQGAKDYVNPCNCIGPQDGQPLCPCQMRNVQIVDGRYVRPAQDLGPVRSVKIVTPE